MSWSRVSKNRNSKDLSPFKNNRYLPYYKKPSTIIIIKYSEVCISDFENIGLKVFDFRLARSARTSLRNGPRARRRKNNIHRRAAGLYRYTKWIFLCRLIPESRAHVRTSTHVHTVGTPIERSFPTSRDHLRGGWAAVDHTGCVREPPGLSAIADRELRRETRRAGGFSRGAPEGELARARPRGNIARWGSSVNLRRVGGRRVIYPRCSSRKASLWLSAAVTSRTHLQFFRGTLCQMSHSRGRESEGELGDSRAETGSRFVSRGRLRGRSIVLDFETSTTGPQVRDEVSGPISVTVPVTVVKRNLGLVSVIWPPGIPFSGTNGWLCRLHSYWYID